MLLPLLCCCRLLLAACQHSDPYASALFYHIRSLRERGTDYLTVSVYRCFRLPLFPFTAVSVYRCFRLPLFPFTAVSVYRCFRLPPFPFTAASGYCRHLTASARLLSAACCARGLPRFLNPI
ncbi:hypothetical protein [Methanimicrococcus hacksteinii]|uniref:hypothetical protein n=1 Tax=Methanimicrococcus hacksteinii TaxID=3028293 RepID=UPI00298F1ED0|nr:hypothetical protein [Methanimicrococcus sp. At1]